MALYKEWISFYSPSSGMLLALSLAIVAVSTVAYRMKKNHQSDNNDSVNLPPIGPTFQEFFPAGMKAENQLEMIAKHGNIFTVPSPLKGVVPNQVVINEPHLVKELCIKQANMYRDPSNFTTRSDAFARATRQVVGTGVTGLKGDEWQWRKTALLKEFHRNRLLADERGLLAAVLDEGKVLCDELEKAADASAVVTADHLTTKAAVGVVLFFLFGRRLEFDTEEMRKAAKDMIDSLFVRLFTPLYGWIKFIPGTKAYKTELKMKNAQKIVDDVVETELDLLLDEFHGRKPVHPDRMDGSVMASLIANEPRFREGGKESMLAEARVFVQAGFETTAHSLAFAMGMMAERPDLADDMAKQGIEAFGLGGSTDSVLGDALSNVEKVKAALDETLLVKYFFLEALRLYPLAPALGGECTADVDIVTKDGHTYTLPKGTSTLFLNIPLQRLVADPDEIHPNRWDVPPKEQPFLNTFQNGPHSCPGKPLSLLEGHVFLLFVVLQFEFKFPPSSGKSKVEFEDSGLLRPRDAMPLLVKRRKI